MICYLDYYQRVEAAQYLCPHIGEVSGRKYSVFFFMPTKVNANFTYLYLIEINDWCLIFSSMFGHLIIYKEIQILIIMWLVKLENLKLVGFQFCRVEARIYCYTKLSIFCFVLFQHYKIMSWRTNLRKDCFLNLSKY